MSQVPVVPGLSRDRIEMKMVSLLQDVQPEALSGQCPTDVETIFEIYIPDQYDLSRYYMLVKQIYLKAGMRNSKPSAGVIFGMFEIGAVFEDRVELYFNLDLY